MGKFDNLNDSQLPDLIRRVERLERGTPMNNAAIGRGGIEVYDGGVITITNGGLSVTGTATITGTLQADGTITFTGTFNQSGPTTFTGDTKLNGPTHINGTTDIAGNVTATGTFTNNGPTNLNGATKTTGTLSVEGVTTLKNDLNVTGSGKINAGDTTIRPSGVINFGSSLTIGPDPGTGTSTISSGVARYLLTPGAGAYFHQFTGGVYVDGRISGMDMVLSNLPTTSSPANLYVDPSTGVVKRSTA